MNQYKSNKPQPKLKTKEEGWNDRFYFGKIQRYGVIQDKNGKP